MSKTLPKSRSNLFLPTLAASVVAAAMATSTGATPEQRGLEIATENRQVRNAHYLLGEVAFKKGDQGAAEWHFEQLGTHYPDFPNLKNVLMALDLRKVVNFKL